MNMKKLFLLNLPYLLFVYPFDKLAQAFRLATVTLPSIFPSTNTTIRSVENGYKN